MLKSAVIEEKKFKHSPRVRADNPFGPKFWYQQEGLITRVICCELKRISSISDFIHIFSWFNKCIYLEVRGRQHQGTKIWCQQKPLAMSVICCKFQKNLFEVWFYTIFMILYMYIAPGQGLTTPWGRNFNVNRNILSLRSFVASFKKKNLWSLILYIFFFFHDFIHVYSPRAVADSPQGTKFWCRQKCLVISFICYKFQKKNVFEVWFYTIFFMI